MSRDITRSNFTGRYDTISTKIDIHTPVFHNFIISPIFIKHTMDYQIKKQVFCCFGGVTQGSSIMKLFVVACSLMHNVQHAHMLLIESMGNVYGMIILFCYMPR